MFNLLAHYWQEKQILNLLLAHLHPKSAARSCSNVSFFLWSRHNHSLSSTEQISTQGNLVSASVQLDSRGVSVLNSGHLCLTASASFCLVVLSLSIFCTQPLHLEMSNVVLI